MKRILLIMTLSFVGTACVETVGPAPFDAEQIVFGSQLPDMKSGFTEDFSQEWHEDDMVGIYGSINGSLIGCNLPYMVNVSKDDVSKSCFTPVSGFMRWAGRGDYVFYAYSPYVMEDFDPKSVPFSLPAIQKYSSVDDPSGFEDYDVIVAETSVQKKDLTVGERADVLFTFRHVFCIVRVDVRADAAMSGKKILKIVLSSSSHALAGMRGKIDMTVRDRFSITSPGTSYVTLDLEQQPSLEREGSHLYFLCMPSDQNGIDLRLSFILEDGHTRIYDYENVVLKSNSLLTLNAEITEGISNSGGVSLPVCMSLDCKSNHLLSAVVNGNTVYFADGTKLERTDAPLTFVGRSNDAYVSSRSWIDSSAYIMTLPLSETLYGKLQLDYTFMSRGLAKWKVDWSCDKMNWNRAEVLTLDDSTKAEDCSVVFNIPQNMAIPQGCNLYLRLKPADFTPCSEGGVPYFDENSDPRLIGQINVRRL